MSIDEPGEEVAGPVSSPNGACYVLRLYVTGKTPNSVRAIANLKDLCDEYLPGRYDLQVIDIYQQPSLAEDDQIVATPTLVKELPPPLRRMIGDLSDRERVLIKLDLQQVQ
jgi:circadian clock protein KaiB